MVGLLITNAFFTFLFTDAPQYHSASCPCPMQSCPKNSHTGAGPTNKAKGPASANALNIADNIPKTSSSSSKIENILSTIKPENKEKMDSKSHELYPKLLESPELTMSPARGSTGLQLPTVQHEAVQPSENMSSDNLSLSQRKAPRVGKSMERERQQQQHQTMTGYQMTSDNVNHHSDGLPLEMPQFKQEFAVKKEGEVKKERDCDDEIDMGYRNINPIENVKLERPEREMLSTQVAPMQKENIAVETVTVNLINESGDECIDYSTKRKLTDSCNEDVIELSDNSTVDPPNASILKRRKLLEKPVTATPKKSPPNSYKSLIKQSNPLPNYSAATSKSKLITTSINRTGNKASIKRRCILKSKSSLKKMRLNVKTKKRATKKKSVEKNIDESDKSSSSSSSSNSDEIVDSQPGLDTTNEIKEVSRDKSEETSTEIEQNEEKSMDGSSEYSGKSNIDLTIDRVAKGYFSESDIFSCLSKHRKTTKSQKKFVAKLIKKSDGKKSKKLKPLDEKTKKKVKAIKEAEKIESSGQEEVVVKVISKNKKTKCEEANKKKKPVTKKQPKEVDVVDEKDPLAIDEAPSSHSTPKRKQKTPKNVEKKPKKTKATEVAAVVEKEEVEQPAVVESDEDDKTVATIETRDEETSTTVLSSSQTINTTKSLLDETDVANNNNECFEDNNRQKQQESLTLYKTPGYGWTTFNKTNGKRGKKGAKFGNRKKHKFTLLNDIVIPKSTSIPRWSNGWVWEGDPFQALVFLNVSA